MNTRTINFQGEEASAIAFVLEQRDGRIKGLEQQLANATKQNVLLRCALEAWQKAEGDYGLIQADKAISKALAATQDLSGYILCDAEPIILASGVTLNTTKGYIHCATGDSLYKARKQP